MRKHSFWKPGSIVGSFLALTIGACDGASNDSPCAGVVNRLRECGLVTEGAYYCDERWASEEGSCFENCFRQASCADIEDTWCDEASTSGGEALNRCYERCEGDDFECHDGSRTLRPYWLCDGHTDCPDGSDELDCPTFTCNDGETIPAPFRCSGNPVCEDGSDELGCPTFTCNDGQAIPASWRCDDKVDCEDGSDELGCATSVVACEYDYD